MIFQGKRVGTRKVPFVYAGGEVKAIGQVGIHLGLLIGCEHPSDLVIRGIGIARYFEGGLSCDDMVLAYSAGKVSLRSQRPRKIGRVRINMTVPGDVDLFPLGRLVHKCG